MQKHEGKLKMEKHNSLVTIAAAFLLMGSCTLGGDYGVQYLVTNSEGIELTVKPVVAEEYRSYENASLFSYIAIPAGEKRLLYNANNLDIDTPPKDFFKSFDIYYNFVLVRSLSPDELTFTKAKSFHATNVYGPDYTIRLQLSELDRNSYATFQNTVISLKTVTSNSLSITWPRLQRLGVDATGVYYQARLVSAKGVWSPWSALVPADIGSMEASFTGLESDSDYTVHVYYGSNQVGLGELPIQTFHTLAITQDPLAAQGLEAAQAGIVGTWAGTMTCPWRTPIAVTIAFRNDGTYSSASKTSSEGPALYYGTDQDSPFKQYVLNGFEPSGARGTFQIAFDSGPALGGIRDVNVSSSTLTFSVYHLNQYGPISFDLQRKS